jgi:hypothetical protein
LEAPPCNGKRWRPHTPHQDLVRVKFRSEVDTCLSRLGVTRRAASRLPIGHASKPSSGRCDPSRNALSAAI